jgi:hypothetical protein
LISTLRAFGDDLVFGSDNLIIDQHLMGIFGITTDPVVKKRYHARVYVHDYSTTAPDDDDLHATLLVKPELALDQYNAQGLHAAFTAIDTNERRLHDVQSVQSGLVDVLSSLYDLGQRMDNPSRTAEERDAFTAEIAKYHDYLACIVMKIHNYAVFGSQCDPVRLCAALAWAGQILEHMEADDRLLRDMLNCLLSNMGASYLRTLTVGAILTSIMPKNDREKLSGFPADMDFQEEGIASLIVRFKGHDTARNAKILEVDTGLPSVIMVLLVDDGQTEDVVFVSSSDRNTCWRGDWVVVRQEGKYLMRMKPEVLPELVLEAPDDSELLEWMSEYHSATMMKALERYMFEDDEETGQGTQEL